MPRFQDMLRVRVPGLLFPLLSLLVACAAFFAGHYIGKYDAEKSDNKLSKLTELANSADQLKLYGMLLEKAHEGSIDTVVRVLEVQARVESSRAAGCLADSLCAFLSASSPEAKSRVQSLVVKYGASSPAGNAK